MPTLNAFIKNGTWGEDTRAFPALQYLESYTSAYDTGAFKSDPYSKWYTDDHVLVRSTGQVVQGGDAAWKALATEIYAPFAKFRHAPQFLVSWDGAEGPEIFGVATLFFSLQAPGSEPKVKDEAGAEWDGAAPAAFKFHLKNADGGFKLSRIEIYSDPSAAFILMLKRGMLKPEQLLG